MKAERGRVPEVDVKDRDTTQYIICTLKPLDQSTLLFDGGTQHSTTLSARRRED